MGDPWKLLIEQAPRPTPIQEAGLASDAAEAAAAPPPPTSVPRLPASELTYRRFCLEFMERNLPVVVQGATEGWRAAREWVAPDGGVDIGRLGDLFGDAEVAVTDTARHHQGAGPCQPMRLGEYLAWWRGQQRQRRQQRQHAAGEQQGAAGEAAAAAAARPNGTPPHQQQQQEHQHQHQCQQQQQQPAGAQPPQLLYCKDWHLAAAFPAYRAYACPPLFADDWLNEFLDATSRGAAGASQGPGGMDGAQQEQRQQGEGGSCVAASDYRFVYLGPQGSCTPLHADVLRSNSWSANVAGRKRWRLLPPCHSHLLQDRHGRAAAWDFFADDPEGLYPGLAEARRRLVTVEQQPGEAIFVPSGWFHTVENLDDCVSINHNWCNGHNVHWAWALLRAERADAEAGIEDCRELSGPAEFECLVQRNVKANAGLDWAGLGALLRCIAAASLCALAKAGHAPTAALASLSLADPAAASAPAARQPAAARSEAAEPAGPTAPGGVWYHAFRLLRAGLVLRELLAAQRRIHAACQQQQAAWLQRQQRQQAGADHGTAEAARHAEDAAARQLAAEVEANGGCLEQIGRQLEALGVTL